MDMGYYEWWTQDFTYGYDIRKNWQSFWQNIFTNSVNNYKGPFDTSHFISFGTKWNEMKWNPDK